MSWLVTALEPFILGDQLSSTPEFALLLSLGLAILAALGFSILFSKLKQPVVLGQLIAGIIIGPFGLGLIQDLNTINLLASLGIILLLFTVGLELDPLEIRKIGAGSLFLATVELTISFVSALAVSLLAGLSYLESVFVAVTVATTSTAIMGRLLLESKSLRYRESHLVVTASVIEDFVMVFVLLLLPGLVAANSQVPTTGLEILVGKGLLLLVVIFLFGWKVAPRVIERFIVESDKYQETAFLLALSFGFTSIFVPGFLSSRGRISDGVDDQRKTSRVHHGENRTRKGPVRCTVLRLYGNTDQHSGPADGHSPNCRNNCHSNHRKICWLLDRGHSRES